MNARERRKAIYELVKEKKFVTTSELKSQFHVSEVTIRNDLENLALIGTLHRVFGGVVYSEMDAGVTFKNEMPTFGESREKSPARHGQADAHIAKIACSLIDSDDVVFLDSSDVSLLIAKRLTNGLKSPLVFTNSLDIFEPMKHSSRVKTILIGGEYDQKSNCFMGELTQMFIEHVRISKVFLAAKGFDAGYGAETHPSSDLHLKKAAAEMAGSVIITADQSSFLRHGTISLLPWQRVQCIVTDQIPPDEYVRAIRGNGINLLYDIEYVEGGGET